MAVDVIRVPAAGLGAGEALYLEPGDRPGTARLTTVIFGSCKAIEVPLEALFNAVGGLKAMQRREESA